MSNNNNLYNILNNFNKLEAKHAPQPSAPQAPKTLLESTMEEVLNEKYMGFKKTVSALKKQGGIENPEALAASIGRKKYGKEKFQKAAAAGKKMGEGADPFANVNPRVEKPTIKGTDKKAKSGYYPPAKPHVKKLAKPLDEKYGDDGVDYATKDKKEKDPEQTKFDTTGIASMMGKKPSKEIGQVSKRNVTHWDDEGHDGPGDLESALKHIPRGIKETGQTSQAYRDAMANQASAGREIRLGQAKDRMAQRAAQPNTLGQKIKKDIGEPLAKLAKGDFKGALSEAGNSKKYKVISLDQGDEKFSVGCNTKTAEGKTKWQPIKGSFSTRAAAQKKADELNKDKVAETKIDKMVKGVFESMEPPYISMEDTNQLSYEQQHLKDHVGGHLFKQIQNALKTSDELSDNAQDVLMDYYRDEMPYGVAKGRTGDPMVWISEKLQTVFPELDEALNPRGYPTAHPGQDAMALNPDFAAPAKNPGMLGKIGGALKTGARAVGKAIVGPGDEELLQQLRDKSTMEESTEEKLVDMMRLAGMPVKESKEKKANDDYDKDGKIESGKDEYLGSKIAAAKKAGKLKEGEMCSKCDCDPCKCDEDVCNECGMYESKCSCNEGNPFTEKLSKTKKGDTFELGGKKYKDTSSLEECMSPMGNGMDDEGSMSLSTNMDSNGQKNITISATGAKANELAQMLKLAGLGGQGAEQPEAEPQGVMVVAEPEEELDEVSRGEYIKQQDAAAEKSGKDDFNAFGQEFDTDDIEEEKDPRYQANTTPEEHVLPTQALTKGGDGDVAGEEKLQHKHGYRFGDNPLAMSENVSLKLMREYESIKITK